MIIMMNRMIILGKRKPMKSVALLFGIIKKEKQGWMEGRKFAWVDEWLMIKSTSA
jgi:hypothetical protein